MRTEGSIINFSQLIEHESWDGLSLTIFYMSLYSLTPHPLSSENLASRRYEDRIIIGDVTLMEYADLLKEIDSASLTPVEEESRMDARIYYVFENKYGETFEVAMWGRNDSMFVNGNQVEEESIFYDVIMPFLPENIAEELQAFVMR